MCVWMELRCEESSEDHADELYTGKKVNGTYETSVCYSHINNGSGHTSANASQKSVIETYRDICNEALSVGWKKINGQWVCPHCVKYRGKTGFEKVSNRYIDA